MAGVLAGVGGAYLTIGSVGSFAKGMSSGEGYIALAAMIFGRYTPFGAIGAALLFGFSTQLQSILSTMNVPIQSNLLLATPYVVTIIVVAGLVGQVRPPKAEGIPYVKSCIDSYWPRYGPVWPGCGDCRRYSRHWQNTQRIFTSVTPPATCLVKNCRTAAQTRSNGISHYHRLPWFFHPEQICSRVRP